MLWINLVSLYLICITVIIIFWTIQVKTVNGSRYARLMLVLSFAVSIYILGYVMELNAFSTEQIRFWNGIEYLGIPYVSPLWLTITIVYVGYTTKYKKTLIAAIYVIPVITMLLRFTNPLHHLYFASISFMAVQGKFFIVKQPGIWMHVQLVHSLLMILVSMWLLLRESLKNDDRQSLKRFFTVAASVLAIGGLILSTVRPYNLPIDYMAICLPAASILVVLAVSRYELLEVKSIARNKAFEYGSDAILLLNTRNKVLDYNESAKILFEQLGVFLQNRLLSVLLSNHPDLLESINGTDRSVVVLEIQGSKQYFDVTTKSIEEGSIPRGWIKTMRDITPIYELTAEMKKQAMTDVLSTLNNRRAFIELSQEYLDAANINDTPLYLIMIDFDHFKNVNDQYSHLAGDLVIREFGAILKEHFGEGVLIARLGGEEFAVLYTVRDGEDILAKIETLRDKTEKHSYCYGNYEFHVTISIGVTKKQADQALEDMMRNADKALYQSKNRGRNCFTILYK